MIEGPMADTEHFLGPAPFLAMIIGAKCSGKSELVRFVTYCYAKQFSYVVCISPTALNQFHQGYLPANCIHAQYSDELIEKIISKQEGLKKAGGAMPQCLLILDDILADPAIRFEARKASVLNKVFSANRHYGLSVLIVAQKLKGLPKICRENSDVVLFTRTARSAWADIYEEYSHLPKEQFFEFIRRNTQDYKTIMYRAAVKNEADHFSVFKIPEGFLSRKFKLVF